MTCRLVVAAACVLIAGCADAPEPDITPSGVTVRGLYLGPAYDSAAAVVSHEAIPGVMEAMRMPLRVADRAELYALRAGDKIEFTLTDGEGGYRMRQVTKLPPDTPLNLADAPRRDTTGSDTTRSAGH
jgi:Cu/Ag efflux protein CusF